MSRTFIYTDIPDNEVEIRIRQLESEGCTIKKKEKQSNGLWTIEAACPEE